MEDKIINLNDLSANGSVCDLFKTYTYELLHKKRFTCKQLDLLVKKLVNIPELTYYLPKDKLIYRARIYKEYDAHEKFINRTEEETNFMGYDEEKSMAPPPEIVSDGRCNPKGISWLYAAESRLCALYEVKPYIGQYVSVATIQLNNSLKLFFFNIDKSLDGKYGKILGEYDNSIVIENIKNWCERPIADDLNYVLTQYICEKIVENGFDGIAFNSSVYSGRKNINYAVYNYQNCKAINSILYRTDDIKYCFQEFDEATGRVNLIND